MSILETSELTKSFDGVTALEGVSLRFQAGKVSALIGPNGAGKTTLFNVISGFEVPDSGSILFDNRDITDYPYWRIARLGIGRLFQDLRVFPELTVEENVLAGTEPACSESVLLPVFQHAKAKRREYRNVERCRQILESLGVANLRREKANNLGYGHQKLVALARLLAGDHKVLLLDEPTTGLPSTMAAQVFALVRSLAEQGKTVIVIEHDMSVVRNYADSVYFLDEGRVKRQGNVTEVLCTVEVRDAYMGR